MPTTSRLFAWAGSRFPPSKELHDLAVQHPYDLLRACEAIGEGARSREFPLYSDASAGDAAALQAWFWKPEDGIISQAPVRTDPRAADVATAVRSAPTATHAHALPHMLTQNDADDALYAITSARGADREGLPRSQVQLSERLPASTQLLPTGASGAADAITHTHTHTIVPRTNSTASVPGPSQDFLHSASAPFSQASDAPLRVPPMASRHVSQGTLTHTHTHTQTRQDAPALKPMPARTNPPATTTAHARSNLLVPSPMDGRTDPTYAGVPSSARTHAQPLARAHVPSQSLVVSRETTANAPLQDTSSARPVCETFTPVTEPGDVSMSLFGGHVRAHVRGMSRVAVTRTSVTASESSATATRPPPETASATLALSEPVHAPVPARAVRVTDENVPSSSATSMLGKRDAPLRQLTSSLSAPLTAPHPAAIATAAASPVASAWMTSASAGPENATPATAAASAAKSATSFAAAMRAFAHTKDSAAADFFTPSSSTRGSLSSSSISPSDGSAPVKKRRTTAKLAPGKPSTSPGTATPVLSGRTAMPAADPHAGADDDFVLHSSAVGFERVDWVKEAIRAQEAEFMPQVPVAALLAATTGKKTKSTATSAALWDPLVALRVVSTECVNAATSYEQLRMFVNSVLRPDPGQQVTMSITTVGARHDPRRLAGVVLGVSRHAATRSYFGECTGLLQHYLLPLCSDDVLRRLMNVNDKVACMPPARFSEHVPPIDELLREIMDPIANPSFQRPHRVHRWAVLGALLQDAAIAKHVYDAQSMWFAILRCRVTASVVPTRTADPLLSYYLLSPEEFSAAAHAQIHAAAGFAAAPADHPLSLLSQAKALAGFDSLTTAHPATRKLHVLLPLSMHRIQQLETTRVFPLFAEVEMPLTYVLASMEVNGFAVSLTHLSDAKGLIDRQLASLEADAASVTGSTFNLGSAKQVAEVLYGKLGLKPAERGDVYNKNARKGERKHESTDERALEALKEQHAVPGLILRYRKLVKAKTGFIEPLERAVVRSAGGSASGGRIYSKLNQVLTGTGRLSSSDPNLQNLPAPGRDAFGVLRDLLGTPLNVRSAFVPSSPDKVLLSLDYSQIEVRVMAHMCGDERLLKMFTPAPGSTAAPDIYTMMAASVFGIAADSVTGAQRTQAKTVILGMLYGLGPTEMAHKLGITPLDASKIQRMFYTTFPKMQLFMSRALTFATKLGYIVTLSGRRRALPDIRSPDPEKQSYAARQAVNTVIQGTAADIIKIAMLNIAAMLRTPSSCTIAGVDSSALTRASCRMLLQIHDELLFELQNDPACIDACCAAVTHIMTRTAVLYLSDIAQRSTFLPSGTEPGSPSEDTTHMLGEESMLRVPLHVNLELGPSWGELAAPDGDDDGPAAPEPTLAADNDADAAEDDSDDDRPLRLAAVLEADYADEL